MYLQLSPNAVDTTNRPDKISERNVAGEGSSGAALAHATSIFRTKTGRLEKE